MRIRQNQKMEELTNNSHSYQKTHGGMGI